MCLGSHSSNHQTHTTHTDAPTGKTVWFSLPLIHNKRQMGSWIGAPTGSLGLVASVLLTLSPASPPHPDGCEERCSPRPEA